MSDKPRTARRTADVPRESADVPLHPEVYAVEIDGAATPHEHPYTGDDAVSVILPSERAAGVVRVGTMVPGTAYFVAPAEALRLVRAKGFLFTRPIDREAALAATAPAALSAQVPGPDDAGGGPADPARPLDGSPDTSED